jgi:hypothetical protein
MWRSHYVVLGEEPSANRLTRLTDGYQLWQETRTGLFYLTAHSEPLGRRPDFAQFLDRQITHRIDASLLDRFMSDHTGTLDLKRDQISVDLIQRTATLAKQLDVPVLAAELTDDEYSMAVVVDKGVIKYLRFKTILNINNEDVSSVEVVYAPDTGFVTDFEPDGDIYGVGKVAIADFYGAAGPNLYNYCDAKPTRDEARRYAAGHGISLQACIESYGIFKRLSQAPPKTTKFDRLIVSLRFLTSAMVLPVILVGMVTYALFHVKRREAEIAPPLWMLICIGMAVLAPPIWLIIWLARSAMGY